MSARGVLLDPTTIEIGYTAQPLAAANPYRVNLMVQLDSGDDVRIGNESVMADAGLKLTVGDVHHEASKGAIYAILASEVPGQQAFVTIQEEVTKRR